MRLPWGRAAPGGIRDLMMGLRRIFFLSLLVRSVGGWTTLQRFAALRNVDLSLDRSSGPRMPSARTAISCTCWWRCSVPPRNAGWWPPS